MGKGMRRILCFAVSALLLCGGALAAWEEPPELVPGGSVIGIRVESEGVIVSAVNAREEGRQPAAEAGVRPGDLIRSAGGEPVHCLEDLKGVLSRWDGGELTLGLERDGERLEATLCPEKDENGGPELGLWLRDGLAGLGTLSFYEPETGLFGALGHSVNDVDSGLLLPLREGSVTSAQVSGAVAGQAGRPGELLGSFDLLSEEGSLERNTLCGVFGHLEPDSALSGGETLPAASREELRTGPAEILCAAEGERKAYSVRIDRLFPEREDGRELMLTVTDPALLEKTGGIVQGMSGSPILQDGKVVGAVTHVLVNDPARGYGISIETMLKAAG